MKLFQYRELLRNLIYKEMKVTYCASLFGLLWSMLIPFGNMMIFWVVFGYFFKSGLNNFVIYLMSGILPWNLFINSITNSTTTITDNGNLIKKIRFPRVILPAANIGFQLLLFGMAMLVFCIAHILLMRSSMITFILYPIITILFVSFIFGIALIVSSLTPFYRDIKQIVEIFLTLLFWMTPIVYNYEMLTEEMKYIIKINPITPFMRVFHDIGYWNRFPGFGLWIQCSLLAVFSLSIGLFIFKSFEYRFVEEL